MIIRHATEADRPHIATHIVRDPIGWVDAQRYAEYVTNGNYRDERIWLAEDSGRVVACAVWWGFRDGAYPLALDCLYVDADVGDKVRLGATLMQAGHDHFLSCGAPHVPEYHLFLTPGWRADPSVCAEVEWRRVASRSAGLTNEVERLRYEWVPDAGMAAPSSRLAFSPDPDDDVFLDVFKRVSDETLDSDTRRDIAKLGVDGQARAALACQRGMPGDRGWWRLAHRLDGQLVGFVIPSANEDSPVIGYIGVVPEWRGHHYSDDLLGEATRILAAHGVARIRADTDTGNVPMAASFERAHYRHFGVRLVSSPP